MNSPTISPAALSAAVAGESRPFFAGSIKSRGIVPRTLLKRVSTSSN